MIIGRGDLAKAIKDRKGFIFYCNGVSNRKTLTSYDMGVEVMEVINLPEDSMLVYISTLSIYYSNSEYTQHKQRMETIIQKNFENYCIFRIGNITWGSNPNTIINYLKDKIKKKKPYDIRKESRYVLDKAELNHWISLIPTSGKHEMNVTGKRYTVKEIVDKIKANEL